MESQIIDYWWDEQSNGSTNSAVFEIIGPLKMFLAQQRAF